MSHSSHRMLAALKDEARQFNLQKHPPFEAPLVVARRKLVRWVQSRPDQMPPIPWLEVVCSKQHPAGRPVLLNGEIWFLRMKLHHSAGFSWITPDHNISQLTQRQPLDFFPLEDSEQELEQICGAVALLQEAAGAVTPSLLAVLQCTGMQAAADLVLEHYEDYALWDPMLVPYSFPSPRTLLQAAFEGEGYGWEREVLEELCDGGGEHWEPWPYAMPVPR